MAAPDSCHRLDRFRLLAEINQRHVKREILAEEIGVTPRTLRRWLHGQTTQVQFIHLQRIGQLLGCKAEDLICSPTVPEAPRESLDHPLLVQLQHLALQEARTQNFERATALLNSADSTLPYDVQAAALYQYARFASQIGETKAATRAFERAIMKADAAGSDSVRFQSFLGLARLSGSSHGDANDDLFLEQAEHILLRMNAGQWRPYLWTMEARQALAAGSCSKALELAQLALSHQESAEAPVDFDSIEALHILSSVYRAVGMRKRSLEILQRAETQSQSLLTDQHPLRGRILVGMASANCFLGNLELSRSQAQAAIQILEGNLPPEHQDIVSAWNQLGSTHSEMQDYDGSLQSYHQALGRAQLSVARSVGVEAGLRTNLGLVLSKMDRLQESKLESQTAIQLYSSQMGADHPDTAAALGRYAGVVLKQGDLSQAEQIFAEAIQTLKKSDPFHVRILDQVRNQATCLIGMQRHSEAEQVLTQHRDIYSVRDESPVYKAQFHLLLAKSISAHAHRKREALELAQQAKTLAQKARVNPALQQDAHVLIEALRKHV